MVTSENFPILVIMVVTSLLSLLFGLYFWRLKGLPRIRAMSNHLVGLCLMGSCGSLFAAGRNYLANRTNISWGTLLISGVVFGLILLSTSVHNPIDRRDNGGVTLWAVLLSGTIAIFLLSSDNLLLIQCGLVCFPLFYMVMAAGNREAMISISTLVTSSCYLLAAWLLSMIGTIVFGGMAQSFSIQQLTLFVQRQPSFLVNVSLLLSLVFSFVLVGIAPFHLWHDEAHQHRESLHSIVLTTMGPLTAILFLIKVRPLIQSTAWMMQVICCLAVITIIVSALMINEQRTLSGLADYISTLLLGHILLLLVINPSAGDSLFATLSLLFCIVKIGFNAILTGFSVPSTLSQVRYASIGGLYTSNPVTATILALFIIAISCLPFTPGFNGYLSLWKNMLHDNYLAIVFVSCGSVLLTLWVQLKLLYIIFLGPFHGEGRPKFSNYIIFLLLVTVVMLLCLGIAPEKLLVIASN